MNRQEKSLCRYLFQNKIYKSDGQAFEDLFTSIMTYSDPNFRKIKAWGKIGDRKNDGYIPEKNIFFQVNAPEDIRKSYNDVINKISKDFEGLKNNNWGQIDEFHFVINDKYKGVNPLAEQTLKLIKENNNLKEAKFFTADNLERLLFTLKDDQIESIIGFIPDSNTITNINYSILDEVIGHIMHLPIGPTDTNIKLPEWEEKLTFNNISQHSAALLNSAYLSIGELNIFLSKHSFLSEELQYRISSIYQEVKSELEGSDNIFWEIINRCSPKQKSPYQSAVIVIMAKYFESCDIFEEPLKLP